MALQTDNLGMIGLSSVANQPPNLLQSPLLNGIHLRWAFLTALGFPWHGFHLFRRPAQAGNLICLRNVIGGLKGPLGDNKHYTALGLISSDKNLVLTDNFAPDQVEFDLSGRANLRFDLPKDEPARRVVASIGFRPQRCVDFRKISPGALPAAKLSATSVTSGPNPLNQQDVLFSVQSSSGQAAYTQIDSIQTSFGEMEGLNCGYGVRITPPKPTSSVELLITKGEVDVTVKAFNGSAEVAAAQLMLPPDQTGSIKLEGADITRIEVHTARNAAYLHRVCFDEGFSFGSHVKVTAFSGEVPVRSALVSGQANQVVTQPLEFDAITAIEIEAGSVALVDLCYVPVAQGATQGWEKLPRFTYPMGLPVAHAKYPCAVKDESAVIQLVADRARTDPPPGWDSLNSISQLHSQLVNLVEGGPSGTLMAEVVKEARAPADVPEDQQQRLKFYPLDLVLIGALHPALAQAVGLYWIDQEFSPNVAAYDYLIVADHTGVGERDADKVLSLLKTSGFAQLDGYIVFNKSTVVNDPDLTPPSGLRAYALPGGAFPNAEGEMPAGINNAGLCWELGRSSTGGLLPDRPIMYLVWRSDMGNADKPGPATEYNLVTKLASGKPKPILVTEPRLPKDLPPQRALDWPPFPLHYIDRNLLEGWYSYQASGIDLFGRHSKNSTPSVWYQWQIAAGDPVPWYYEVPAQETNVKLVGSPPIWLLEKHSPPKPTAVKAHALDPKDAYLVRDQAYKNWYNSISPKTQIGLRVSWTWTEEHQRQARDTREFRLYFNLGTDPPVTVPPEDRDKAVNWQERLHVVGYNESYSAIDPTNQTFGLKGVGSIKVTAASGYQWWAVSDRKWIVINSESSGSGSGTVNYTVGHNKGVPRTGTIKIAGHTFNIFQQGSPSAKATSQPVSSKEDRVYEVFLPLALKTDPTGLSLTPSLDKPIIYAHIGVSAADDKPHSSDLVKSPAAGNWANRFGNEGRVGPPAKIYLVLREPPQPPALISDEDRVYASPADYRDRSYYTYRWQTPKESDHLRLHLFRAMDDAIFKRDWLIRTTRFALDPGNAEHQRYFPKEWKNDLIRQNAAANALNSITSEAGYSTSALSTDAIELLRRLPGNDGVRSSNPEIVMAELKQRDWPLRHTRQGLTANDLNDLTGWDSTRCQVVATELNTFILSGTAANVGSTSAPAILELDGTSDLKRVRPYRDIILLKSDTKSVNRQYRIIAVDDVARTLTLDTLTPEDAPVLTGGTSAWMIPLYQTLSDGSLRALALLPENEQAFTQVTIDPLDSYEAEPGDAAKLRWRDRKGPDNSEDFILSPDSNARRAFIDTLDGRSTNRYVYRAAFVDGAHNPGKLGKVGPVVYLPNVGPPRTPVITKVVGGDRQITIKWASNREPDLAEYRVYRADSEEVTRDLRLMTLVHAETVPTGDPAPRPPELTWINTPVPGMVTFYYCLVAADTDGNISDPTRIVVGRAFDDSRPDPPTWKLPVAGTNLGEVVLTWSSAISDLRCLVQRQIKGNNHWENVSNWLPRGTYTFTDSDRPSNLKYNYRLRVMDNIGRTNNSYDELTA